MRLFPVGIIMLLLHLPGAGHSQDPDLNSFLSRISTLYNVEIALAPELIPALDSIQNFNTEIRNIEEFLDHVLHQQNITYQVIDGNKILLRREDPAGKSSDLIEISGTVIDPQSNLPLAFAAITHSHSHRGTFTNEDGLFTLGVEDTTGFLQIHYLGFKPVTLPVAKSIGKPVKVIMEADNVSLDQVIIIVPFQEIISNTATQALDLRGYRYLTSDDISGWHTADYLISNITGYTQFSTEEGIRIRSSHEENSLVMMDDVPVYNPYHFYNIFSPFNGHYFSSASIYKNNIPVQFGGRIDGMIDLRSDSGKRNELIFDTDLLLTSAAVDIALSKKTWVSGGFRFSHTGWLHESLRGSSSGNMRLPGKFRASNEWTTSHIPTFSFYDINLGYTSMLGNNTSLKLAYFKNKDYLGENINNSITARFINQEIIHLNQILETRDNWYNEGISFDIQSRISDKVVLHTTGFLSDYEKDITYKSFVTEQRLSQERSFLIKGLQTSLLQSRGIKSYFNKMTGPDADFTLGLDFQMHEIDLLASENIIPYLLEVQHEYETTLFGEIKQTIFQHMDFALGSRLTYLNSTSTIYPQPLLRINYAINDQWHLKSSFSKNIQAVRELTVENRFGREIEFLALSQPEAGYPVLRADKLMIGGNFNSGKIYMDAELYYKKTDGLIAVRSLKPDPSFPDAISPGDVYRLFTGDGRTAGLDILASIKSKKAETSISYTISKIEQRYERLFNGNYFSPKEDRRHQIKLSSRYQLGKFTASGLLAYKTEASYISLIRLGAGDIEMTDQGMVIGYLPFYFTLDLGMEYDFLLNDWPAQIGVSVINATDHSNINNIQHIGRVRGENGMGGFFITHETELPGRIFNVHFKCHITGKN